MKHKSSRRSRFGSFGAFQPPSKKDMSGHPPHNTPALLVTYQTLDSVPHEGRTQWVLHVPWTARGNVGRATKTAPPKPVSSIGLPELWQRRVDMAITQFCSDALSSREGLLKTSATLKEFLNPDPKELPPPITSMETLELNVGRLRALSAQWCNINTMQEDLRDGFGPWPNIRIRAAPNRSGHLIARVPEALLVAHPVTVVRSLHTALSELEIYGVAPLRPPLDQKWENLDLASLAIMHPVAEALYKQEAAAFIANPPPPF